MNCSLRSRLKIMGALKKLGMKSALSCYAQLKLHWLVFSLGSNLRFGLFLASLWCLSVGVVYHDNTSFFSLFT